MSISSNNNVNDKEFCASKQLSLLPNRENATFRNLTKQFLFHRNDIGQSNMLSHNIPEHKENKYIHKGMLFVSLFIQILLKHIDFPLKKFGSMFEYVLNGFIIQRKPAVWNDKEGKGVISTIGLLDKRMELDKGIKQGDARYYPALTMMAAKLAYETEYVVKIIVSHLWKMDFVNFYNFYNEFQQRTSTQAFIMREQNSEGDRIIVAFRGTSPFCAHDWSTDFDFSWLKIQGMGKIHKGFLMALGLQKCYPECDDGLGDYYGYWPKHIQQYPNRPLAYYTIREKLRELLANNPNAKFIMTGHSLGGALAILFPAILALHGEVEILDRLEAIYTYGQPRVGNEKFGGFMKKRLKDHDIKYYRIVYGYDIVPRVPLDDLMMFKHFGTCIHFNCFYQGKIVAEEQIKRTDNEEQSYVYLRLLKAMPLIISRLMLATLIAVWQLIRGFVIGYLAGPDYEEGWLLLGVRMVAIFVPSAIDHFPQDYVNATRLASQSLFRNYPALPTF